MVIYTLQKFMVCSYNHICNSIIFYLHLHFFSFLVETWNGIYNIMIMVMNVTYMHDSTWDCKCRSIVRTATNYQQSNLGAHLFSIHTSVYSLPSAQSIILLTLCVTEANTLIHMHTYVQHSHSFRHKETLYHLKFSPVKVSLSISSLPDWSCSFSVSVCTEFWWALRRPCRVW